MSHLTCEIAVRRASDHLSGLLTDDEAAELDGHLTGCEHCSCLLEQLRETVAVLGSRPGVPVAWGHVRDSGDDASITELGSAVDAALARLDPLDRGLLMLVDIEGAPVSRAALELELSTTQARKRLGNARFAVRAALDRHLTG